MKDFTKIISGIPKYSYLIVLVLIVSGYIFYKFTVGIQLARLNAVNFQFCSEQRLIQKRSEDTKSLEELRKQVVTLRTTLRKLEDNFIDEATSSQFFANIRTISRKHNCDLLNLFVRASEPVSSEKGIIPDPNTTAYQKLPVELSIKGSYANVISALFDLMEQSQLIEMSNFKIETVKDNNFLINASILLKVYALKEGSRDKLK